VIQATKPRNIGISKINKNNTQGIYVPSGSLVKAKVPFHQPAELHGVGGSCGVVQCQFFSRCDGGKTYGTPPPVV
jgi:hypothetical protein